MTVSELNAGLILRKSVLLTLLFIMDEYFAVLYSSQSAGNLFSLIVAS